MNYVLFKSITSNLELIEIKFEGDFTISKNYLVLMLKDGSKFYVPKFQVLEYNQSVNLRSGQS